MRLLLLTMLGLVAALPACADQGTVLAGRMPSLSQGRPAATGAAAARFAPAPVPNPDMLVPVSRTDGTEVSIMPSLTRTETAKTAGDGFAPGSAFSGQMERRDRSVGAIGTTLAPSVRLRVPVQVELR